MNVFIKYVKENMTARIWQKEFFVAKIKKTTVLKFLHLTTVLDNTILDV